MLPSSLPDDKPPKTWNKNFVLALAGFLAVCILLATLKAKDDEKKLIVAKQAGFESLQSYDKALDQGFTNRQEQEIAFKVGATSKKEYELAKVLKNTGFTSEAELQQAQTNGFENKKEYDLAQSAGFTTADAWHTHLEAMKEHEQEERMCRGNAYCWGEKHLEHAETKCIVAIEDYLDTALKAYYEWTYNGTIEIPMEGKPFNHFEWAVINGHTSHDVVSYIGYALKIESRHRAWFKTTYTCNYDTKKGKILNISVIPRS